MRFPGNVARKRGPRVNTVAGMKWCPKCDRRLAIHSFGLDKSRDDGLSGWCRACRAAAARFARAANPALDRVLTRRRYRKNPERWHAKVAVARAVAKGLITKAKACEVCFRIGKVEAHHYLGYEKKNWLTVKWVCRQCHSLEHKRGESSQNSNAA